MCLQRSIGSRKSRLSNAVVLADIVDVFVDFICQHKYFRMLSENFCQCSQLFFRVYATGRVAWRAENEHLGLLCDGILQLLCCHLEVLVETCVHDDRSTACQLHHLWVAYPIWSRDDNLTHQLYRQAPQHCSGTRHEGTGNHCQWCL